MNTLVLRLIKDARTLASEHRLKLPYVAFGLVLLLIYIVSQFRDSTERVFRTERAPDFKDARVLGSQGDSLYEGKEKLLTKTLRELMAAQAQLRESNEKLTSKVEELEKGKSANPVPSQQIVQGPPLPGETPINGTPTTAPGNEQDKNGSLANASSIRVAESSENLTAIQVKGDQGNSGGVSYRVGRGRVRGTSRANTIISFPVKDVAVEKSEGIVLPAGSYVKAKLMTGIEAPEGKTYPVLLQLDYAYIVPNKKRLDLSGCFMIAKSQGDLSTERVQMQAIKLSCVSKEGRMFEREVSGFIADDKDNSFAVIGTVNSKQDRVAAMAFLSKVVEGVGKALQQSQTTSSGQLTNGGSASQSNVTGDKAKTFFRR